MSANRASKRARHMLEMGEKVRVSARRRNGRCEIVAARKVGINATLRADRVVLSRGSTWDEALRKLPKP